MKYRNKLIPLLLLLIGLMLFASACTGKVTLTYPAEGMGEICIEAALPLKNQRMTDLNVSVRLNQFALTEKLRSDNIIPADAEDICFIPEDVTISITVDRSGVIIDDVYPQKKVEQSVGKIIWENLRQDFASCSLLPAISYGPTVDIGITAAVSAVYRCEYSVGSQQKSFLFGLDNMKSALNTVIENY